MSKTIKLRKGLNIRIEGTAEPIVEVAPDSGIIALKPTDFPGLTPRLLVKPGQEVKAGEPLFHDKYDPEVVFVSPVGGVVESINRGERRKILEVLVKADKTKGFVDHGKADPMQMEAAAIRELLIKSGLWPFIRRRPYGTVAKTGDIPKSVFISCFDSAPLAPDYNFILKGEEASFQTGVNALSKLTTGKVHLGLPNGGGQTFSQVKNAEITFYEGPHPAGNVGIQIHHTDPVMKGEVVWTLNPQDVLFIGRLFETGKIDFSKKVAITGPGITKPRYLKTILGASIKSLLDGNVKKEGGFRIISGNVLTGTKVLSDNFLGFYDSMISLIPEGNYYEFLGWAMPRMNKFSMSRAYFSWLNPKKEYCPDTNLNGEERAYVLTGQYEKVLPMELMPVQLIKAVVADDIDKMEKLGIYEVIEEDLALCEYVCTSKMEVQHMLRKGINLMIKELG